MEVNEEKRKKFMEFAGKRVNNVMHDIQILEPIHMILQKMMLKKCFQQCKIL